MKHDNCGHITKEEAVTLKDYIDTKIKALEDLIRVYSEKEDTRFISVKESTDLARIAMDKRLDAMNEFRDTLKDQASRLLPRDEYVAGHKDLTNQIAALNNNQLVLRGKDTGVHNSWLLLTQIIGLIISVGSFVILLSHLGGLVK